MRLRVALVSALLAVLVGLGACAARNRDKENIAQASLPRPHPESKGL
jgi:hypothetical protein